jgi:hypothetical protein
LSAGGGLSGDGYEGILKAALVLFLMLMESLASARQRSSTLFQQSPHALEFFAASVFRSNKGAKIGRICGLVMLGQPDLYSAHFVILWKQRLINLLFFNFDFVLGPSGSAAPRDAEHCLTLHADLNECARENNLREADDEHACGMVHNSGMSQRPCRCQRVDDLHVRERFCSVRDRFK